MKRLLFFYIAFMALFLSFSCSNKQQEKTREDLVDEFRSKLTSSDTTQMLEMCDKAMELLKNEKIDQVISSLYEYNDSTKEVQPLSELMEKRLRNKFKLFPVLSYVRKYYSFMLEGCNDVKYDVVFSTKDKAGTDEAPVMAFMFNPVKIDGEWKLCVKTLNDKIDNSRY